MKKIVISSIITVAVLSCAAFMSHAQTVEGVTAEDVRVERNGDYMSVSMTLNLSELQVRNNRAVVITPRIVNSFDVDSLDLQTVGIYGRHRWMYYARNNKGVMITGTNEISYRKRKMPESVVLHDVFAFQSWMDPSKITLQRDLYGCCGKVLDTQYSIIGAYLGPFMPELVFVRPEAEREKTRSIAAVSYIDFHVDKTFIDPEFRQNPRELATINATINDVKDAEGVTITSIYLKGYASPEGTYAHNTDLAKGRTEALKTYIMGLYNFEDGTITTDYESEDWADLRDYVQASTLPNRDAILAIIDESLEPDAKELKIKNAYPEDYKYLLANCYPALRHTEYKINYDVKSYSDIEELRRVMKSHPQNMSLEEFYLVAQDYEPGSEDFSDAFETAVRLFPEDEIANLNAANATMSRGDLTKAAQYLAKAGDSAEAEYARGAYACMVGDYAQAEEYMKSAAAAGLEKANEVIDKLNEYK